MNKTSNDGNAGDPAMLAWIETLLDHVSSAGDLQALYSIVDRTRGQLEWMRLHEPDRAAPIDALIRLRHRQLQEGPTEALLGQTAIADSQTDPACGQTSTPAGPTDAAPGRTEPPLRPTVALVGQTTRTRGVA